MDWLEMLDLEVDLLHYRGIKRTACEDRARVLREGRERAVRERLFDQSEGMRTQRSYL
jgi:hypothetical protein